MARSAFRIRNPWASLRGLPLEVWALCASTLVNRVGTMALVFLVLYLTKQGWRAHDAGLLMSWYGVGSVIASPIAGRLSDRIAPKYIMLASLFTAGVLMILFPTAHSTVAIVVLTMLWSLSGEAYRPASFALVGDSVAPEKRKVAFSVNRLAVNLGASIGPAIGGLLATVSMAAIFWVDGVTSILAGIVLAIMLRGRARRRAGHAPDGSSTPHPHAGRSVFADRRFLYFLAATLPASIVFFQALSTLPLDLVRGQGMSERAYGALLAINGLLIVLIEVPLSAATARWRHGRALALGAFLACTGMGLTAFAHNFVTALGTLVVWTFGEMILFPAGSHYVTDTTAPERRGEALGAYTGSFGLAFLLAPLLGTAVLDRWGANTVWAGAFGIGLVATAMLWRVDSGSHPSAAAPSPA